MKVIKNEKGITLLELLVSIVILSLVLYPLIGNYTAFIIQSKEADRRIVLLQEATKKLEEQRQAFYDRMDYLAFTDLNDKPVLETYYVDMEERYVGEVRAEFIEQDGRYQLVKLTSSIGDLAGKRPAVEVSQYVTNR